MEEPADILWIVKRVRSLPDGVNTSYGEAQTSTPGADASPGASQTPTWQGLFPLNPAPRTHPLLQARSLTQDL